MTSPRDRTREKAAHGDAWAQYSIGSIHYHGKWAQSLSSTLFDGNETTNDSVEAEKWFLLAATQGHAMAQYSLGSMYAHGQGIVQDSVEALKWIRLAAAQGYAKAQCNLGVRYAKGEAVPQDLVEAVKWTRLAAAQGDAWAQFNLSFLYAQGEEVIQDYVKAVQSTRIAAAQGDARAQYNLGFLYAKGQWIAQDLVEAEKWFRLAAAQGDAGAQFNLGFLYIQYQEAQHTQDYEEKSKFHRYVEAVKWFRLAAAQGDARAQYSLGNMHYYGTGTTNDSVEAAKWFLLSAAQGYAKAQSILGHIYTHGQGVTKDSVEGVKWTRLAAAQGYAQAQFRLGDMYTCGDGVAVDYVEAVKWTQRAAAQWEGLTSKVAQQCLVSLYAKLHAKRKREEQGTSLQRSPFAILGATVRDSSKRIVELAEEKALHLDHDLCQKARSDLTNLRTRLTAEMAWLPGLSPKRAAQLTRTLLEEPQTVRAETGLPTLAHANLLGATFEFIEGNEPPKDVADFIQLFAGVVEALAPEEILRDINEDRSVSLFPGIKSLQLIEDELIERRYHYKNVIMDALNRMPTEKLIQALTLAVDVATHGGEEHAPALIDALVDSYEVKTQSFLQKEAENIDEILEAVALAAPKGEQAVKTIVDKLENVARNWDRAAQPIQLSMKARGCIHRPSYDMAYKIRDLGVDLYNKHGLLGQAERVTILLRDIFAEVPEAAETLTKDSEAIEDIRIRHANAQQRQKEWAKEITYEAEIGLVLKHTLRISPAGLEWKGMHYSLESVTRVRWGGSKHSINGIPTGTDYTIAFGDNRTEAVVSLRREAAYSAFIDRLWKAVCVRLINDMLVSLRDGKSIQFGDAMVEDSAVSLTRHKFFSANERVRLAWSKTHVWSAEGNFVIGSRDDKKIYATSSYIETPNTHVLEAIIRLAFKKEPVRLSNLLKDD